MQWQQTCKQMFSQNEINRTREKRERDGDRERENRRMHFIYVPWAFIGQTPARGLFFFRSFFVLGLLYFSVVQVNLSFSHCQQLWLLLFYTSHSQTHTAFLFRHLGVKRFCLTKQRLFKNQPNVYLIGYVNIKIYIFFLLCTLKQLFTHNYGHFRV